MCIASKFIYVCRLILGSQNYVLLQSYIIKYNSILLYGGFISLGANFPNGQPLALVKIFLIRSKSKNSHE